MNICYFSSDKFVSVLATSIVSLLKNVRDEIISLYIIDDGISEKNKLLLTSIVSEYNSTIDFIEAPDPSTLFDFCFKDRYQLGHSYVRMGIGSILPKTIKRILVLDSDTLITSDLSELWNIDLKDNIIAGVADCIDVPDYRKRFFIDSSDIYCNAGVFLVDLDKWRLQHVETRIKEKIKECNGNIFFFEQTLINYACRGQILKLHPKYNAFSALFVFSYKNLMLWRKPSNFYSEQEVNVAIASPAIIHFTRNFYVNCRPWTKRCKHPFNDKYKEYKNLTPWPELEPEEQSIILKITRGIIHILPQRFISFIASILYNTVRPKLIWKNE